MQSLLQLKLAELNELQVTMENHPDESFIDKLIRILEYIWSELNRAIKLLLTEVGRIEFFLARVEQDAKANIGVEPKVKTIDLMIDGQRLLVNGKLPDSSSLFVRELLETKRQFEIMAAKYPPIVISYGEKLLTILKHNYPNEKERLEDIVVLTENIDFDTLNRDLFTKYYKDSRFRDGSVQVGPPMLGNKSIFVKSKLIHLPNPTLKGRAATARQLGVIFTQTKNEYHELQERSMNVLYAKDILIITEKISSILYAIKSYGQGNNEIKMADIARSLASELKTLKLKSRDAEDQSYFKESVKFVSLYSSWVAMPMDALVAHMTRTMHASVSACKKSINAYGH